MGGWTGLRLAIEQPERVSALVLSNTTAGVSTPAADRAIAKARQAFAEHGISASALAPDFPSRAPGLAYLYAQISGLNLQVNDNLHSKSPASTSAEELASLKPPTLLISSDKDTIFPPEAIREIGGLIPGADFVQLPEAGHSPYFETPNTFNDKVCAFLNRHLG